MIVVCYSAQHEACEEQDQQVTVTARFRDGCVLFVHGQSDILRDTALSSNFAFPKIALLGIQKFDTL